MRILIAIELKIGEFEAEYATTGYSITPRQQG